MTTEEIEEQIKMSQVAIPNPDLETPFESSLSKDLREKVEIWRAFLALFLLLLGVYLFIAFLPIVFIGYDGYEKFYYEECCQDNLTHCKNYEMCERVLDNWAYAKNISKENYTSRCCFWYAPLDEKTNPRLHCFPDCLFAE